MMEKVTESSTEKTGRFRTPDTGLCTGVCIWEGGGMELSTKKPNFHSSSTVSPGHSPFLGKLL